MNLGHRITALRKRKYLTQDQIAEALGVKRGRYNAWENSISNPDHEMLAAIAKFHHVTVDFLLGLPHPEGLHLLSDDMYADGYTDESFFQDMEKQLEMELEGKNDLRQETRAIARKFTKLGSSDRKFLKKLIDAMDEIQQEEHDED